MLPFLKKKKKVEVWRTYGKKVISVIKCEWNLIWASWYSSPPLSEVLLSTVNQVQKQAMKIPEINIP